MSAPHYDRLKGIQDKLLELGVTDVKFSKDAQHWNELSLEERSELLCSILEAWLFGKSSPFPGLNDSTRSTYYSKEYAGAGPPLPCDNCGQPYRAHDVPGMRFCPSSRRVC